MEDLVPAQWTGQEATFEPNLEKHAKWAISHEAQACLPAGTLDTGFHHPSLRSPFFMDLGTPIFLGGSASLSFSVHVVCVEWTTNPGSRIAG